MRPLTKQAEALNAVLKQKAPVIYAILSEKGKAAYFPKDSIVAQTQEAKNTKINATIGEAYNDSKETLTPESLAKFVNIKPNNAFLYAPTAGNKELRQLWKKEMQRKNPALKTATTLPVVCAGLTHGLTIANNLFINDNDQLITPDLFWGNYHLTFPDVEFITFPTFSGAGFNVKGLQDSLTVKANKAKKKIIIFNFPNNPSGYSLTRIEAQEVASFLTTAAKDSNLVVILDDAYFGLFYEKNIFKESLFSLLANASENLLAIKIDGISKELYAWGLRVAFITYACKGLTPEIADVLEDKTTGIVRGSISNVPAISQALALTALQDKNLQTELQKNHAVLQQRYAAVKKLLEKKEYQQYFTALPFNSGYFMCIQLKKNNAESVRKKLIVEYNTGVISQGNLLRIAFSSVAEKDLKTVFANIAEACKALS